jgi:phosphatidylserine synthase
VRNSYKNKNQRGGGKIQIIISNMPWPLRLQLVHSSATILLWCCYGRQYFNRNAVTMKKIDNMEKIMPIAFAVLLIVIWFMLRSNEKLVNNLWFNIVAIVLLIAFIIYQSVHIIQGKRDIATILSALLFLGAVLFILFKRILPLLKK